MRRKCAGLSGEQLAECAVPPSNLSLLGLVRHMAKVERRWFRERIAGQELEPMYDPALGEDADFEDLDPDRAQTDYERLLEECRLADEALAAASYDETITARAGVMSVRTVVVRMIEEYAQHNGHADLLRERTTAQRTSNDPHPYTQPELPPTPPPGATGMPSADGPLTARTSGASAGRGSVRVWTCRS